MWKCAQVKVNEGDSIDGLASMLQLSEAIVEPFMMNINEKVRNSIAEPCAEPVEELLGSLTTYNATQKGEALGQSVRTSARVFKKMRQDTVTSVESSDKDKKDVKNDGVEKQDKENGVHVSEIGSKPTPSAAKQRMPKALWSTGEKNLFFEALNEYGKDFDSITSYICNKVNKKKPLAPRHHQASSGTVTTMTKNKHQVSHFYYRTWQKVSKFVKFGDDVKKVVQELYALINFGELRKRLVPGVVARAFPRLSELVWHGVVAVRSAGRTIRVRTPVCRALRRLNRLEEWEENLRFPTRVNMWMCPRDMEAWSRVHAAAHNPRVMVPTAPSRKLAPLLTLLQKRWLSSTDSVREQLLSNNENKYDNNLSEHSDNSVSHRNTQLALNVQKLITPSSMHPANNQDACKINKLTYQNGAEYGTDTKKDLKNNSSKTDDGSLSLEEGIQSLSHKTNAFETERDAQMDNVIDATSKTAKNADDTNDRDECELNLENASTKTTDKITKRPEPGLESQDKAGKWQLMEESRDLVLHVGPKPGITFNIPSVNISEHLTSQRICLSSFMERVDTTERDGGCQNDKTGRRFRPQKRQRKDSGENDPTLAKKIKSDVESYWDKNDHFNILDVDETANDGMTSSIDYKSSSIPQDINDDRSNEDKDFNDYGEKEIFSEQEDDEKYNNETDGECDGIGNKLLKDNLEDVKKSQKVKGHAKGKVKKEKDSNPVRDNNDNLDENKSANTYYKKNWNKDILKEQVKKGWSMYDSGDLTIGDLYLMFGIDSKLELNYWWAKSTPPFTEDVIQHAKKSIETCNNQLDTDISASTVTEEIKSSKNSDLDKSLLSPKLLSDSGEIDANKRDGDSVSPDHKNVSSTNEDDLGSFNLVTKIVNNPLNGDSAFPSNTPSTTQPFVVGQRQPVVTISMRLKKLLSLSQLYMNKNRINCSCGHVCSGSKGKRNVLSNDSSLLNISSDALGGKYSAQQKQLNKLKSAPCVQRNISGIRPEAVFNQQHLLNKNKNKQILSDFKQNAVRLRLPDLTGEMHDIPQPMQIKMEDNIPEVDGEVEIRPDEIFRAPISKGKMSFNIQPYPSTMNKNVLDLGDLPRWTNRGMKKPKPEVVMRKLLPLAPNAVVMPQPIITIVPAAPPSVSQSRTTHKESKETVAKPLYHEKSAIIKNNKDILIASDSVLKSDITLFSSSGKMEKSWVPDNVQTPDRSVIEPNNLSNLLDISLPSIGDVKDSDIGVAKHDDFSGLLTTESMSIPSMSPSRLLKDDNWLSSDVQDFSLSSFLGHLESVPSSKLDSDSSKKDGTIDVAGSSRGTIENVDTHHLHCLMSETSIDYMAKFADLAAQVTADSTK